LRNLWGSRWILAGVAGAAIGGLIEALANRVAGTTVIVDGIMWGAALAILLISLPNFAQMGRMVVKSDKPAIHFLVGILMFILISLVLMTLFFGIFLLLSRLLS
jgi:hypothetical protein